MSEPTLEQVGQAVDELRKSVEAKSADHDKIERIQSFLDEAEEKINQPLVAAQQAQKTQEQEIKDLKADLEAKGVEAGQIREKLDELTLALAHRSMGSEAKANFRDSEEYKALNEFCKVGHNGISLESKQLLRTDSAVEGGVLVPSELDSQMLKEITEIDPIRSVARVRSMGSKTLTVPIRDSIPSATYEGEQETGADSVSNYKAEQLTPFRQTYTAPITMDMLMDSAFDMNSEIASDAAEAFAFGEGQGFISGTGFKQPEGITTNANLQAAARDTAASGVLDPESIILLTGDLKVGYSPVYVLNRRTLASIRTFRADAVSAADSAGAFLWSPGFQDVGAAGPQNPNTINGFPYILANSMPDVAAGAFSIIFGDLRQGYMIVDRTGMSVVRDEFTLKKRGIIEFTMNRWNTGQVVLEEAIKLLRILP